jgi:hypothetical protein
MTNHMLHGIEQVNVVSASFTFERDTVGAFDYLM